MVRNSDRFDSEQIDDLVIIGEIGRPHGTRGEVKVFPYSERPENFKNYKVLVLQEPPENRAKIYKIIKNRQQGKLAILQLEGVASREAAKALQGSTVLIKKTDLPELGTGEFYYHQLEGLLVITGSGRELGRVSRFLKAPAHDIMVVTGRGREYLIPVRGEVLKNIDDRNGKLFIEPPPGLLEANE